MNTGLAAVGDDRVVEHSHDVFSLCLWVHGRVLQEAQHVIDDGVVLQVLQDRHEHRLHVDVVPEQLILTNQEALVFEDGYPHVLIVVTKGGEHFLNGCHLERS